jgi:hypothetical protein
MPGFLMALADDLRTLRDAVLNDLNAAHDYYTDTEHAWRIVQKVVASGRTFIIRNTATGSVATQAQLARKAVGYVEEYLAEATFQQFLSIFETFFFDLLRLWFLAYPQNLYGKTVDFKAVHESPDKETVTLLVIDDELNRVLYKPPRSWFTYLEDKVKLGCPTPSEIDRIAEAKTSRDVLVHNRGIAGKTYELKAGKFARYGEGEKIYIPEPYHRETWDLICKMVTDIANAAIAKAT